jgi:hypothetical protein
LVRVEADKREQTRRAVEDERVQDRLHKLREEAAASGRANAAVQLKWSDILERNLPQELAAELAAQKHACTAILSSKSGLMAQLAREMKAKDEDYVKALQQQRDDVEQLVVRMGEQFAELSSAYEAELGAMESAFMEERSDLMLSNKREVDALFEARRSMEARFVEEKLAREEAYSRELADMQAADAENYQKLKVKLEADVSVLEQQLEAMKFTYLLNTEKLEYNYRVLTERDSENKQTLAAQKQRLARLRGALSKVQAEYESTDVRFKARNAALTEEYTRITKQYRELQSKFRHFEAAEAVRYGEVSEMHGEEMRAMAGRLVSADKVITEQLLGWTWAPPPAAGALEGGASAAEGSLAGFTESAASSHPLSAAAQLLLPPPGSAGEERGSVLQHSAAGGDGEGGAEGEGEGGHGSEAGCGEGSAAGGGGAQATVHPVCLRALLRLLVAQCAAFLVDARAAAAAASLRSRGQGHLAAAMQADTILRALGCEQAADVAALAGSVQGAILAAVAGPDADPRAVAALAARRLAHPLSLHSPGGSGAAADPGADFADAGAAAEGGALSEFGLDVPSDGAPAEG